MILARNILLAIAGLLMVAFFLVPYTKSTGLLHTVLAEIPGNGDAKVLAVGDMQFDRMIREVGDEKGTDYIFSCITPLLNSADFAVGNLEGPITDNPSMSLGSVVGSPDNFVFTFPPDTAPTLAAHHFAVVNLGNNHIDNFGLSGIASTRDYLTKAGVQYFGGIGGDEPVARKDDHGVALSFVSYNEFGGATPSAVAAKIKTEHDAGRVVIVYAHWGDEYEDASARLRPIAKMFADAGASAIIGMHPHIVLGHETIDGALVYYSIGNFIFDQYWETSVRTGLTLMLHISKSGEVTADEIPVTLEKNGQTCPAVQEAKI